MSVTTEVSKPLDSVLDSMYGRLRLKLEAKNVLMTAAAQTRMASILGWITGFYHAGKVEFATEAARQLTEFFEGLNTDTTTVDDKYIVPARKYLLFDDGTFHSFSFLTLYPVSPKLFREKLENLQKAYLKTAGSDSRFLPSFDLQAKSSLKIRTMCEFEDDITEHKFDEESGAVTKIYYYMGFNGGIIYHGPGAGQTFTVRIGDNSRWWGMHT